MDGAKNIWNDSFVSFFLRHTPSSLRTDLVCLQCVASTLMKLQRLQRSEFYSEPFSLMCDKGKYASKVLQLICSPSLSAIKNVTANFFHVAVLRKSSYKLHYEKISQLICRVNLTYLGENLCWSLYLIKLQAWGQQPY